MEKLRGMVVRCTVVALVAGVLVSSVGEAQRRGRWIGVGAGFSAVGSRNPSGVERAIHLQLAAGGALGSRATAALVFDAYAMSEGVAEPGCIPGGVCESWTTHPGAVLGLSLEARAYPWEERFSLAAGVGGYWGPSVKGSQVSSSSAAVSVGADYEFGESRLLPSIGFRFTHLTSDIAGVRWMASPSLGLRF